MRSTRTISRRPGCRREYLVVLGASAFDWPIVSVSAGVRGVQLLLAPADYQRATRVSVARIQKTTGA
jgi:Cys-tRNA(Pro)/Cys-tRNA(Cys) deacylase